MSNRREFYAGASQAGKLLVGANIWTADQEQKLQEALEDKRAREAGEVLNAKGTAALGWSTTMEEKLQALIDKKAAPITLGETGKTYVREKWLRNEYGYREVVKTDTMDKGNITEQKAITLMEYLLPMSEVRVKNTTSKQDDRYRGICDVELEADDMVEDNKSSWTINTYQKAAMDKLYEVQLHVYGRLYGRKRLRLWYTLHDTPAYIIEDMKRRLLWKFGGPDVIEMDPDLEKEYEKLCDQIEHNHTPTRVLDPEDRAKVYEFERDDDLLETLDKCVDAARVYYNQLELADIELQPWKHAAALAFIKANKKS